MNYDADLKEIVRVGGGKRVLLHCCCAPCASHCIQVFSAGLKVTAYFYNPCIMPFEEYQKRAEELKKFCSVAGVDYLEGEYDNSAFLNRARGLEGSPEGGERCKGCFFDRLSATAQTATQNGFDYFCTTLTVSPHKNSSLINDMGFLAAANAANAIDKAGAVYLPSDFKKDGGYQKSIELSRKYGLYRQNYCGCVFSKRD